jgi:hypothetical protein
VAAGGKFTWKPYMTSSWWWYLIGAIAAVSRIVGLALITSGLS